MNTNNLVIERIFEKLYTKSKAYGFWHDIWYVKYNWLKIKVNLLLSLTAGNYFFEPLRCVHVKKYYQSIDHHLLHNKLCNEIKDKFIQRLLWQYMDRIEILNGEHRQIRKGIAKGGILSPLLGAIFLEELDKAMERKNVHYVRYMDDWVILTKTRSELRKLVKLTHKIMKDLKLTLHPDKTFIGKISKGFDFLGYRFTKNGLRLAMLTIQRFQSKLTQLYEQGASNARIEQYRKNWRRWAYSGDLNLHTTAQSLYLPS